MRTIKKETEYKAILARIDELVEIVNDTTPKTSKEYIELDFLTDMIVSFEKEFYNIKKPSLAEVMKLRMFEMNLTQKKLSEIIGVSPSRVSEYLTGKADPTLNIAREISKKLNIDSDIVLGV
ncbi:HTH-type transcriptional regulator/antitoxin HigA [Parabacteroides sp. PF5-5]|uniref:helix-turn-helix domain-containing protein n=1 Tax=unclassified Parabacteroides TaxID=2649774 RepID=UPI00247511AE|nr:MULTISPECIES: helix-turn-helix domain-containing protein [unclassified Parabacteroides]MDH6303411.1 HTH-type transcriptional regulator/antitoxin HigA [Parabacteroides sp. PH5-39]MDH6314734.1 HTH-type transcriptional regulator/antitoxin HigA [Parabacteroides sp. PF5-13]MDH6318071.1 HTH-type transcriptional regulator/antitoxin HigA [Parabacteroides sp. PH5-13]MDH6321998.1 HTH-type transcriptional regulator/antitoxin HigA [Parabacteroides sp. PH5-8]MDH6326121.1 HTH-type transcriptional regulat